MRWWAARAAVVLGGLAALLGCYEPGRAQAQTANGESPAAITVKVGWDTERQEVTVVCDVDVVLPARSPALARLRGGQAAGGCPAKFNRDGTLPGLRWTVHPQTVTQAKAAGNARLKYGLTFYLARVSGHQTLTFTLDRASLSGSNASGLAKDWTVRLSFPRWQVESVTGPLTSQFPNSLSWRVTSHNSGLRVTIDRTVRTTLPSTERHQRRDELVAALVLSSAGLTMCVAMFVARVTPERVRRRWLRASWALTAVTWLLVASPARWFWTTYVRVTGQSGTFIVHGNITGSIAGPSHYPAPEQLWSPGPVLALWLWYLVPVLGWWFSRRLATGRPPSVWIVSASCAAPLLALLLLFGDSLVMTRSTFAVVLESLVASLTAYAIVRLIPATGVVRRWAGPALGLFFMTVCLVELSRSPLFGQNSYYDNGSTHTALVAVSWPAAAWITSLLPLAAGRRLDKLVLGAVFVLVWLLMWPSTGVLSGSRLTALDLLPWPQLTGYWGLPYFTVGACLAALAVGYLLRVGRDGRSRAAAVGPCGMALMVWAAANDMGNPSLRTFTAWGSALAVFWAAVSWRLLVSADAETDGRSLRRVSRGAHTRLIHRWISYRQAWDARGDLQRTTREAMAEGTVTVAEFSSRWRQFDVPGSAPDQATALARLKRSALGSGAGATPTASGLAAAVAAQVLALPWAVYKLATGQTLGRDLFMPAPLEVGAELVRFGHWAVYGFVFGYFYTWIKGGDPVVKALVLFGCVLPIELFPTATVTLDPQYTQDPSWTDFAIGAAGVTGQSFVICMGLGLLWEWQLARAAAVRWSQLRNFRRLGSITVPLGTVLVAAATAYVTVVAGALAEQQLTTPPEPTSSHQGP
ncbi:hypothetical protein [Streptomyces sp. NPDC127038]|uniref:hypothetical protein n=1 Tax=Streptomyces sp. NPDC127038 TaxID=3347114 RepID=UPI003666CAF8